MYVGVIGISLRISVYYSLSGVKQAVKKETSEEEKKSLLLGNYSESIALPSGSSKNKEGKKGPFRR